MSRVSLRAAAVGDSVLWGQGQRTADKYVFRAIAALRAEGIVIDLPFARFHAQSGAQVALNDASGTAVLGGPPALNSAKPQNRSEISGEVPSPQPTVLEQFRRERDAMAAGAPPIALVFADGGANDMDFAEAALPRMENDRVAYRRLREDFEGGDVESGIARLHDYFVVRLPQVQSDVEALLRSMRGTDFVLYTGYYDALGPDSYPLLRRALRGGASLVALQLFAPLAIAALLLVHVAERRKFDQLTAQLGWFHLRLHALIAEAAWRALRNGVFVRFVDPRFGPENRMGTAQALVAGPDEGFDRDVRDRRLDHFDRHDPGAAGRASVRFAHLAHPNAAGHRRYADRLIEETRRTVSTSLRDLMSDTGTASARGLVDLMARTDAPPTGLRSAVLLARVDVVHIQIRYDDLVLSTSDPDPYFSCRGVRLRVGTREFAGRAMGTQRTFEVIALLDGIELGTLLGKGMTLIAANHHQRDHGRVTIRVNGAALSRRATRSDDRAMQREGERASLHFDMGA